MRIRSISLRNYRRYAALDLELPDGMVSIIGSNGAGKSTLMEAVAWALFGNESEIVRTDKVSVKRQGAAFTDECMVRVEFDYEDAHYMVERSMRGKAMAMAAELYAGGQLVARGTDEVTEAVERLFGMDHKAFFISVFARQKELNALTSQPKGERKKIVLRLLGIDDIDGAIARIRRDGKAAQEGIAQARAELAGDGGVPAPERLNGELDGLAEREKSLAAERAELQAELKKMEGLQRKLKKSLDSQERQAREAAALQAKAAALAARMDELGSQLGKARAELEGIAEMERESKGLDEKAAKAAEELEQVEGKRAAASAERDALREDMAALKAAERQLEREMRDIEKGMAGIADMGPESECPTCKRPLGKTYADLLEHFKAELKDRQKRLAASRKEHKAREAALADCDGRLDALAKREGRLKSAVSQAEVLRSRLEHAGGRRKHLAELEAKLRAATEEHDRSHAELESMDFDQDEFDRAKGAWEGIHVQLRDADRKMHEKDTELARIEERRAAAEKELARLRALEAKIEGRVAEAALLSELDAVMSDFRLHLISRVRPALASISSELLGVLTDGRYTELELSEDYDISVRDRGEMFDLERFSGGEKDLANLCLRLAISEVISTRHGTSGFDMIVLDEIFGSQDAERKRLVLSMLNGLGNRFKQIFLITHVEDVKELMGNVIRVSEGSDGTAAAEVVQ